MGETAEERARRLSQIGGGGEIYNYVGYTIQFYDAPSSNWNICQEIIIDGVCDEPTVSLVKEYSKGSFKFV